MEAEVIINDVQVHGEQISDDEHQALTLALDYFVGNFEPDKTEDDEAIIAFFRQVTKDADKLLKKINGKTETVSLGFSKKTSDNDPANRS